ncbi:MAG: hypothetical protein ABJG15_17725 [Hyphomonadaceae bacterium]
MSNTIPQFSTKQYFFELLGAFAIYTAVLFATIGRVGDVAPGSTKMALALAPVFPLILVFLAIMRAYKRSDEMHKRILKEAFAMGAIIFGWLLIILGFAENGGAPKIPMVFIAPLLIGFWGLCMPIVLRRYK